MKKPSKKLNEKLDIFEGLIVGNAIPEQLPVDFKSFSEWENKELGVKLITRSIIYAEQNQLLKGRLERLLKLTKSCQFKSEVPETASLKKRLKNIASQLSMEREMHLHYKNRAQHLEAVNKSLAKELNEFRSKSNVIHISKT